MFSELLPQFIGFAMGSEEAASIFRIQTWLTTIAVGITVCLVIWQTISERLNRRRKHSEEHEQALREAEQIIADAKARAEEIRSSAKQEVVVLLKQARLQAHEASVAAKEKIEKSAEERKEEIERRIARVEQREDNVTKKETQLQATQTDLTGRELALKAYAEELDARENNLAHGEEEQNAALEKIAQMSQDEAKNTLMTRLENSMTQERAKLIRRYQEENRQQLTAVGQKIMLDAMQRYAGDCTYERTTSTVPLPNEEMKGRIIGREGRNIRTLEAATGANILIDDTPQAVVISCFDPVRREIARLTIDRLVADGRIHPSHIEEIVAKTKKEIDEEIDKAGREAVERLGILNLRQNIVTLLGRLKFRYSFSQNILAHSIEVASMMGAIAADIKIDAEMARRAGLLHDIGKAVDHEVEGSHAIIGAELLRRAGEAPEIINAVAAHHGECEKNTMLAELVQICDTLSAGRPGARCETTEFYLKRLEDLEKIGNSFEGVESCYAIQAGRELRVVVAPDQVSEERAQIMAHDIAERIEREMRYPGQIRVSIIRETRAVEYAK
jgi:ribonucrease Y